MSVPYGDESGSSFRHETRTFKGGPCVVEIHDHGLRLVVAKCRTERDAERVCATLNDDGKGRE